jgi:hypothetical protein
MIENMDLAKVIKELHRYDLTLHILTTEWSDGSIIVRFVFTTCDGRHRWEYAFDLSELYIRNDGRLYKLIDEAIRQVGRKAKVEEDDYI